MPEDKEAGFIDPTMEELQHINAHGAQLEEITHILMRHHRPVEMACALLVAASSLIVQISVDGPDAKRPKSKMSDREHALKYLDQCIDFSMALLEKHHGVVLATDLEGLIRGAFTR